MKRRRSQHARSHPTRDGVCLVCHPPRHRVDPNRTEPCNVCHAPVSMQGDVNYIQPRCLDCDWRGDSIFVFCSGEHAQQWMAEHPPETIMGGHGH